MKMKTEDLRDRMVIELTEDVQNPKPDRRKRYDWRYEPVIRKGSRFTVWEQSYTSESLTINGEPVVRKWFVLHAAGRPSAGPHDPLYFHLLTSAEPVSMNLREVLNECGVEESWGYKEIVEDLVESGKLSLDDVREILTSRLSDES